MRNARRSSAGSGVRNEQVTVQVVTDSFLTPDRICEKIHLRHNESRSGCGRGRCSIALHQRSVGEQVEEPCQILCSAWL